MSTKLFWQKVEMCEHPRADLTSTLVRCSTPYCHASESYCPDCRAYIVECQCGSENGISGWSNRRWRKHQPDTYLGELFTPRDVCASRHKGNTESNRAFESIKDRLTEMQERVLRVIRNSDGLTCNEIAEKLGLTPNQVSGRITELKRDHKIYVAGKRLTRSRCPAAILKTI